MGESGDLTGRTVLAVFAHPDDESLACGGTLAKLSDAGATVVLICASRGEKGSISDPALVPDGDLGRVRTNELRDAAEVLGIAEVVILDHPDGDLRWRDHHYLHIHIVETIRRCRPDAVITFGEDGLYWHLDHIGVHERTCDAIQSLAQEAPPLYFVTIPNGIMSELANAAIARGWALPESGFWGISPYAFGWASTPTLVVDVRDWAIRKLAALRCHRTQMGAANPFAQIDQAEAPRWLGFEHFRRAPGSPAAPVLECIGEPVIGS